MIVIRGAFIIVMMVLVIRQMLGRGHDKVAAAHEGLDPLAGAFGWVDRLTRRSAAGRDGASHTAGDAPEKKVSSC